MEFMFQVQPTRRAFLMSAAAAASALGAKSEVSLERLPAGALQPQILTGPDGRVHRVYFKGEPLAGDLWYERPGSQPLQVNACAGSAVATGSVRGAHVALGKNGQVHVAWNGSKNGEPKGPKGSPPMLYTRLTQAGTAFERERNVIHSAYGLDGGGSVAADGTGNVYVFWHAPTSGDEGEAHRRVWVAHSSDGGMTFGAESIATREPTGACGCCGMAAFADSKGNVYALYRSASADVHRDMYLLVSSDRGQTFRSTKVDEWEVGSCVMSTAAFTETADGVLAAWETKGQIRFARVDRGREVVAASAPGDANGRKHPALSAGPGGAFLLAWTEGTGWKKGGNLAWQVYDRSGQPKGERGQAPGVLPFSFAAAYARRDGGFTIVY